MSIYSNNKEEQDLIKLRKLVKQQKKQRAIEIKNRILKQTHDNKLAENFSPVTKKVEVDKTTQKVGEITKESNSENKTPQLAIEKTQNDSHPVLPYDAALENTLSNLKEKQKGFFKIKGRDNGDLFWNDIPFDILGDSTLKINEDEYIISTLIMKMLLLIQMESH